MITLIAVISYFGFVCTGMYYFAIYRGKSALVLPGYILLVLLPVSVAVPIDFKYRIGVWVAALVPGILWMSKVRWLPGWFSGTHIINGYFALVSFSVFVLCLIKYNEPGWVYLCAPALAAGLLNLLRARETAYGSRGDV